MTEPDDRPRLYGEKEVATILERASKIHAKEAGEAGPRSSGLSLAELEEIATEAGIPRDSLRQAVRELETRGASGAPAALAGASPTILLERTLPVELDREAFESLVFEIQRATGMQGQGGMLGRTLTWQADTPSGARSLQVMVTTRPGQTRIRIEERLHQLAGQLFGGLMGGVGGGVGIGVGVGLGIGALGSVLFAVTWPVGVLGATYLTARTLFRATARKRQRELRRLMDVLSEVVEASGGRSDALESGSRAARLSEAGPDGEKNAGSS